MANTILNAAEYQIEGGLSLKPGNYLAKITEMEIETTDNGKRVNFEFVADQGRKKEKIFYEHSNPDTQRIGRNDIKRICDFTGNPTIHLTEDPRTLEPLKNKPIAIAVRTRIKNGAADTYTVDGKTYERRDITHYGFTLQELPEYDNDFDEVAPVTKPTFDPMDIMNKVSRGGTTNVEFSTERKDSVADRKDDVPY